MAQITIYLPDKLEKDARKRAKRSGKSMSRFFADLLSRQTHRNRWPKAFAQLYGSCDLPAIEDLTADEVDGL